MYLTVTFADKSPDKTINITETCSLEVRSAGYQVIDAFAFGGVSTVKLDKGEPPVVVPDPVVEPGTALVAEVPAGADTPDKIIITTDPSTVEDLPVPLADPPPVELIPVTDTPADTPPAAEVLPTVTAPEAPPLVGPGSSRDSWAKYAESLGIEITADMARADIIVATEAK